MALKIPSGGQFENPAPGSYIARCYAVIDLGTQAHNGYQGNPPWSSRDMRLVFELPAALMTGKYHPESKGKPFAVSTTMKQSLAPTAKLRKFLRAWRGRDFTKEELADYNPKKLLGVPCRLALVENGDFINIEGASKLGAEESCPVQVNKSVYFSLEADEFDAAVLKALGPKTQEKIAMSPEYSALLNPKHEPSDDEAANISDQPSDEDVPF